MPSIALPTASIARVLLLNPWFAALDADTRNDLVAAAEPVQLPRGGVVFRQGELSTGFYGLVHGALCVSTVSETGREAVLTVLEPGHWFGEASALDGLPRSHDVVACSDARLLRVGRDDFNRLMLRSGFARAIALLQAHYLRTVFAML
ncbi:Crp/Fnr family transcriptional regulator [Aquabacterium sp. OR-4]|uniref:Crp/Fnr family transcriptional regulator n=1 Tax=Aquabacterium sp. OR-4 TaxID=2978127 RepID=UPI0021B1AF59|nr:cyclic nucleotide-binding domain-containing protein [Aquabacterium sp. OR-4]MDT7836300.1 cyclic nucleotide-binding domain-containing protein [Aquabacterium sp. OR-4]